MGLLLLVPLVLGPGVAVQLASGSDRSRGGLFWRAALAGSLVAASGQASDGGR